MYVPNTISEQIEVGTKTNINHRTMNSRVIIHDEKKNMNITSVFSPIYSKYKDYFDKITVEVPLTEKEQLRYRFAPKLVSLDVYNTVDYWALILYINECPSVIDFKPEKLKWVVKDKIEEFINELMILDRL